LIQLGDSAGDIPAAVVKDANGLPHVDDKGLYNPGAATMDTNAVWQRKPIHDGKVHGEKPW